ncbi:MAG: response regulator [Rhodospirillales bacterium]
MSGVMTFNNFNRRSAILCDDEWIRPCQQTEDGVDRIEMQKQQHFDLIITDILMPRKEGLETLQEIKSEFPETGVIAISGGGRLGNVDFLSAAELLGADAVLAKPFSEDQILKCVNDCLASTKHLIQKSY